MTQFSALPTLAGSAKQRTWATNLRQQRMGEIDERCTASGWPAEIKTELAQLYRTALLRHTDAAEWIDARHHPIASLLRLWLSSAEFDQIRALTERAKNATMQQENR